MQDRLTRQERKTQTRERLIDAAAQVFARRGFEAASLDEVAAAAGYTKGAVYSNFASKTELFVALIERRIEVESARHASGIDGASPEAASTYLAQESETESEWDRQWLILAIEFWLHAMRDERARALLAEQYERARTVSAELIASFYRNSGQEPTLPARDMAIVIEALSIGLGFQSAIDPQAVKMSLQGDVLVNLFHLPLPAKPQPSNG